MGLEENDYYSAYCWNDVNNWNDSIICNVYLQQNVYFQDSFPFLDNSGHMFESLFLFIRQKWILASGF